jgi:hypothetical protein
VISELDFVNILVDKYGPLISGDDLVKTLGYKSADAFRQSKHQGTLPIRVFKIKNRRGYFASVIDIADWLQSQR